MMTKVVLKPINKIYLLGNTIFVNKVTSTLQKCILEKHHHNRMLHSFCNRCSKKLFGTESLNLKKLQFIKETPRFFTSTATSNGLMDMKIQFHVPFLKKFITPIQYFRIRKMDNEFDLLDFKESAKYALEVVLNNLSNEQYSELETLLTPECKNEVVQNVKTMTPEKRSELAIDSVNIFAEDGFLNINEGVKEGKIFGEVTMIYFVSKDFKGVESIFSLWSKSDDVKTKSVQVYNCTFIKDLTEGLSTSQWKINGINFSTIRLNYFKSF